MRASNNSMIFKTVTSIYYISWIFIGNFILLNLFLSILLDAFNDADDDDEENLTDEEKARQMQIADKKKKEMKKKRMKKLGTTVTQMRANAMGQSSIGDRPAKRKKDHSNFTGKKFIREDDFDDIDSMTAEEIRKLLVDDGLIKAQKKDNIDKKLVGKEIHAENSIYLFNRHGCFRRNVHFI